MTDDGLTESKLIGITTAPDGVFELYRRTYTATDGTRCFLIRVLKDKEVIAESPILYTAMSVTGFINKYAQQYQISLG